MLTVATTGALVLADVVYAQAPPAPAPAPAEAAPSEGAPEGEQPLGEEEAMVLNFERADIREVIHSLATALGISYSIDPRIEGQVTIRTTGKIARSDLFPLFNQILRNNGIAAVKVGDVYQIVPVGEARTRAIVPRAAPLRKQAHENDNFVIEIIALKHLSSDEMVTILQQFATPGGDVFSYPRANVVVVTDLESNVARLRELAATFDVNVFRNLHARVFKVQYGDPEELSNEVLGLLAPYGVTPTGEGEGGTFVIPLQRLNSIVVIAVDQTIFGEFERWLRMLDIPPDQSAGRQTFVYNVENAKAADLAEVLNELFGGGPGGGGAGGLGRAPGAPPAGVGLFGAGGVAGGTAGGRLGGGRGRGGTFGGAGGGGIGGAGIGGAGAAGGAFGQQAAGGALGGMAGGGGRLGGRGGRGGALGGAAGAPGAVGGAAGGARGVSLPGGPGAPAAPGQPAGPPPIFKQEVRIVADDVTNSLVILATKRDFQLILDVLRKIDVVPRQVILDITIAEIDLTKDLQFGLRYALAQGELKSLPTGDIFHGLGGFAKNLPAGGLIGNAVRVPESGAFAVITDGEHFNLFINALNNLSHVKMLSAPHIIAADNREAHILVGQSIPIQTGTAQSTGLTGTLGAVVSSIQYRDTGKVLTILPQVNSKGLVNLQIRQEVSAVLDQPPTGTQNLGPSFSTREAETTAVVQDGHTLLIGGIIDDQVSHTRTGLPFVMDIPVLGRLFRSDTDSVRRTELLILITPYVMRSIEEGDQVTTSFAGRIEGLNKARRAIAPKYLPPRMKESDEESVNGPVIREKEEGPATRGKEAPPAASPTP